MNKVVVTEEQMSDFIEKSYGEDIEVEGFEGWDIEEIDTSTGDFDSEKGAMTDYEINLISPNGDRYVAWDGYYTGVTGHCFYGDIVFELEEEKESFEDYINSADYLTEEMKKEILDKYEELG